MQAARLLVVFSLLLAIQGIYCQVTPTEGSASSEYLCHEARRALDVYLSNKQYNADSCQIFKTYNLAGCLCLHCPHRIPAANILPLLDYCNRNSENLADIIDSSFFSSSDEDIENLVDDLLDRSSLLSEQLSPFDLDGDDTMDGSSNNHPVWVRGFASENELFDLLDVGLGEEGIDISDALVLIGTEREHRMAAVARFKAPRRALVKEWKLFGAEGGCFCDEPGQVSDRWPLALVPVVQIVSNAKFAACRAMCSHEALLWICVLAQTVFISMMTMILLHKLHNRICPAKKNDDFMVVYASDHARLKAGYEPLLSS